MTQIQSLAQDLKNIMADVEPDDEVNLLGDSLNSITEQVQYSDKQRILAEHAHIAGIYDDPALDVTNFDTIVNCCFYQLLEHVYNNG